MVIPEQKQNKREESEKHGGEECDLVSGQVR